MPPDSPNAPQPFEDNAEYLDAEFNCLAHRLARLGAEARWRGLQYQPDDGLDRDPQAIIRVGAFVTELRLIEEAEREHLDSRLKAHRASRRPTLWLDRIEHQTGFGPEERLILLALSVPAIMWPSVASEIIAFQFGAFYSSFSVYELFALQDPQSVADWLRLRKIFKWDSPLRRNGLINVDAVPNEADPSGFISMSVSLSIKGFSLLTGDTGDTKNGEKGS